MLDFLHMAGLAQGRAAAAMRKGVGSSPTSGSRVETWTLIEGRFHCHDVDHGGWIQRSVVRCPQCGCTKRPHVSRTYNYRGHPEKSPWKGFDQAHCNYCKVRWFST